MTTALVPHVGRLCTGLLILLLGGCAAFRPIQGISAKALPPEYMGESRAGGTTIDLSRLAQVPPRQHYVDAEDVLGIYIEGVLGRPGEPPPVSTPLTPDLPPSIGFPFTVRDDGTISLPMVGAIDVRGLTIRQVEDKLREAYTVERDILKVGQDRIIVTLQRPRQVRVLVLRQEAGGPGGNEFAQGVSINLGQTKRGNGQAIELPIYRNDVLHALARTGGLPGLDAENTIYIIRRQHRNPGEQSWGHDGFAPYHSGHGAPENGWQYPAQPGYGTPAPQQFQGPYGAVPGAVRQRDQPRHASEPPHVLSHQSSGPASPIQLVSHEASDEPTSRLHRPAHLERLDSHNFDQQQATSRQPRWREQLHGHEATEHAPRYWDAAESPVALTAAHTQEHAGHRPQPPQHERHSPYPAGAVISQREMQHPEQMSPRPSPGGYTIAPVHARNFRSGNPLDELRAPAHRIEEDSIEPLHHVPERNVSDRNHFAEIVPTQAWDSGPAYQESFQHEPNPMTLGPMIPPQQPDYSGMPPGGLGNQPGGVGGGRYGGFSPGHQAGTPFPVPPQPVPQSQYNPWSQTQQLPPAVHEMLADPNQWQGMDPYGAIDPTMNNSHVIKIPVRLRPGEQPHIRPEDVILQDGDIVFIESRETEIFYTGGLLGGGQFTLPRDYDLDILGAIAIAQGASQQVSLRQVGGVSAINGDVTISASNVIILRQLPGGQQIPIKVDLYKAIRDPSERVLIQPGDIVMLRYKPLEAVGAFVERNLLESALLGIAAGMLPAGGAR